MFTTALVLVASLVISNAHAGVTCNAAAASVTSSEGYLMVESTSDTLREGYSNTYTLTLKAGVHYRFVGCGSDGTGDLDMRIYDENGNLISRDTMRDNLPFVDVTPKWTGSFQLKVDMTDARRRGNYVLYEFQR